MRVELATVTDDPDGLAAALGPAFGLSPEEALASPHALAGPVGHLVDVCVERRERFGISYVTVPVEAVDEMAPVVAALAGR